MEREKTATYAVANGKQQAPSMAVDERCEHCIGLELKAVQSCGVKAAQDCVGSERDLEKGKGTD